MKILHTADNHFENSKIDEAIRCFEKIISVAEDKKVDLIVQAGDWFDKNILINSPAYYQTVPLITRLANIAPLIIVRGNHDPNHSLDAFPQLSARHPIMVFTDYTFATVSEIEIVAVPYKKRSDFNLPTGITLAESNPYMVSKTIEWFHSLPEKKGLRIFIGHLTIADASLANNQMISTSEPLFRPSDLLESNADVYFLGHIHNSRQAVLDKYPMRYSGPHYRTNFAEQQELGFWIYETEGKVWQWFASPTRPVKDVTLSEDEVRHFIKTGKLKSPLDLPENCEIRMKVDIPQELASSFNGDKLSSLTGAKVEKRILPQNTARSREIINLHRLTDKYREWAEKSNKPVTNTIIEYLETLELET